MHRRCHSICSTWEENNSGFILTIKWSFKNQSSTSYVPHRSLQLLHHLLTNTGRKKVSFHLYHFLVQFLCDYVNAWVETYVFKSSITLWPCKVFICTMMCQGDSVTTFYSMCDASTHCNLRQLSHFSLTLLYRNKSHVLDRL